MPSPIIVPALGESITEAIVANWLQPVGARVEVDMPLVELETDKVTVEVPSPVAGVLSRQLVEKGATVRVGEAIGEVDSGEAAEPPGATPGGVEDHENTASGARVHAIHAVSPEQAGLAGNAAAAPAPGSATAGVVSPHGDGPAVPAPAMPSARAEATRAGVDLAEVTGTGRGGRILKEDVQRAAQSERDPKAPAAPAAKAPEKAPAAPAARPAPAAKAPEKAPAPRAAGEREEVVPMTPLRRRVAERLVQAQQTAAILTTFNEVDMSAIYRLRAAYKQGFVDKHGVKLGFMSFFVKASVSALKAFPAVNAEIRGDDIVYKHYYDIGVAVGGGKGLVVPVVRGADALSFAEVEKEIGRLGGRARDNKLTLEELSGGTFTISNGGVYGSMLSTPILNPPQTGILGLHNVVERPVAVNGQVEVRPVMYLALSYDHRLVDGREAVQFLVHVKERIEAPERLLLEV
jgi:2-oxoglutarate dehydrogenase E2 component (dihydrolipoamide succinyltransferase)